MHLQFARHLGGPVIVCVTIEARLRKAEELGAHETVNAATGGPIERIKVSTRAGARTP